MKPIKWTVLVILTAVIGLSSCETGSKKTINESDLYGYWYCESSTEYMRIMHDENEKMDSCYLGYEWKVGDKQESDLLNRNIDYHKNGWFEWQLKSDQLTLYHLSNIGSVIAPKTYTIKLSAASLEMRDGSTTKNYTKTNQPQ